MELLIESGVGSAMASAVKSGALVFLEELHPPSPFFADGSSLRVIGKHGFSPFLSTAYSLSRLDGTALIACDCSSGSDNLLTRGLIIPDCVAVVSCYLMNTPVCRLAEKFLPIVHHQLTYRLRKAKLSGDGFAW